MRGFGRVFKRGRVWWISYCVKGKEFRESSKSYKKSDAKGFLKKRLLEKQTEPVGITLEYVLEQYISDAELAGKRSVVGMKVRRANVLRLIGQIEISKFKIDIVRRYQKERLAEGVSTSTVNREISLIKTALKLAVRNQVIPTMPVFPSRLLEPPPRKGFFEHGEYEVIRTYLPGWAQDILDFCYYTGWRRGEVLGLTWFELDPEGRTIRLDPTRSKNGDSRLRPIRGELASIIARRKSRRQEGCPYVFHRDGHQISPSTWAHHWQKARKRAGASHRLLHDTRRTTVRNLVRSGVSEKVAMLLTGHKSRAVFDRYNIVNEDDLEEAIEKLERYIEQQDAARKVIPLFQAGSSHLG